MRDVQGEGRAAGWLGGRTLLLLVLMLPGVSGCTLVYRTTGEGLVHYSRTQITPYLMAFDDADMACRAGETGAPVLAAFDRVQVNISQLSVFTASMSGTCAEERALQQELRLNRALHRGDHGEAQDARTLQKRHSAVAARRFLRAWQHTVDHYGDLQAESCPRLRRDFDQLVFMVGLLSGVQALMHDTVADLSVGVPRDVPALVERAASCLDNARWWGLPDGIRAAIWTILPMFAPDDADPWQVLEEAIAIGDSAGVRINSALYVIAAYSAGEGARIRHAVAEFADRSENLNPDYAILDAMANLMVRGVSDRIWSEMVGQRTPFGRLGQFPGQAGSEPLDVEAILDLFD